MRRLIPGKKCKTYNSQGFLAWKNWGIFIEFLWDFLKNSLLDNFIYFIINNRESIDKPSLNYVFKIYYKYISISVCVFNVLTKCWIQNIFFINAIFSNVKWKCMLCKWKMFLIQFSFQYICKSNALSGSVFLLCMNVSR